MTPLGVTVYGCEEDEAELFGELAPRFGVAPTTTSGVLSGSGAISVPRNRCASVGHTAEVSERELRALRAAGVEHLSTRSIGLDHIDVDAAADLGIAVENVVYSPDGVADFTLMLILMSIRHATEVLGAAAGSDRPSSGFGGGDLRDLTIGVVGVGRIGQAVIRRLQGFGSRVVACSSGRRPVASAEFVPLDVLLRVSDVVTLHVPLDADTHHIVGRQQIDAMRSGAVLINTGRGALVDTDALITALERGRLGGAALDVLDGDAAAVSRLHRLPNVIVTPHAAYRTRRALHEIVEATLTKVVDFERRRTDDEAEGRDPVRGLLGGA